MKIVFCFNSTLLILVVLGSIKFNFKDMKLLMLATLLTIVFVGCGEDNLINNPGNNNDPDTAFLTVDSIVMRDTTFAIHSSTFDTVNNRIRVTFSSESNAQPSDSVKAIVEIGIAGNSSQEYVWRSFNINHSYTFNFNGGAIWYIVKLQNYQAPANRYLILKDFKLYR